MAYSLIKEKLYFSIEVECGMIQIDVFNQNNILNKWGVDKDG